MLYDILSLHFSEISQSIHVRVYFAHILEMACTTLGTPL